MCIRDSSNLRRGKARDQISSRETLIKTKCPTRDEAVYNNFRSLQSVSYTHLDVYKRQHTHTHTHTQISLISLVTSPSRGGNKLIGSETTGLLRIFLISNAFKIVFIK